MHLPSGKPLILASLLLLLFSTTSAIPTSDLIHYIFPRNQHLTDCPSSQSPALPKSDLPPPSSGLKLKRIDLGYGTQNYTCPNSTASPVAAGAVASLYDVSCLVANPEFRLNLETNMIPSLLKVPKEELGPFLDKNMPKGKGGNHYFRDATTAIFALNTGASIAAGRVNSTAAASNAAGNQNGNAVDWLKLRRKPGEPDGGLQEVYRVLTAGGRAPANCTQAGPLTVPYLTEYWYYG